MDAFYKREVRDIMLIDANRPSATAEMIAQLADHLRLPQGFADDAMSAAMLGRLLDVAVRVVEERSRRALLQRSVLLRVSAYDADDALVPPIWPVASVQELALEHADGARTAVDPSAWRLASVDGRAAIKAAAGRRLPAIPRDGYAEARLVVGYGAAWSDAPEDLRLAAIQLAATYYEQRNDAARVAGQLPLSVAALLEPYRRVRL